MYFRKLDSTSLSELSAPSTPSMFGIDHMEFNKKIAEYKTRIKEKQTENKTIDFSQQQQEQLLEIKKQKLLKKKFKKQQWVERNHVDPKDYLLASDNDLYSDNQDEYDTELEEDIEEKEDGGSKSSWAWDRMVFLYELCNKYVYMSSIPFILSDQ